MKLKKIPLLSILLLLLLQGCSNQKQKDIVQENILSQKEQKDDILTLLNLDFLEENSSAYRDDLLTNDSQQLFAQQNNRFAFDLLAKLDIKDRIFFSPLSISEAVAMVYMGAANKTKDQISDVLHFDQDELLTAKMFQAFNKQTDQDKEYNRLKISNALWFNDNYDISDSYVDQIVKYFDAQVQPLDFSDSVNSANIINSWVDQKTNHKITEIVSSQMLNDMTTLVLVNAIYFHKNWKYRFNVQATQIDTFYNDNFASKDIEFMQMSEDLLYHESSDYQAVSIPYDDEKRDMSMLVILPKERKYKEVKNDLSNIYTNLSKKLEKKTINLKMPKFEFRRGINNLKPILIELGMVDAFDPASADFSKIFDSLWIDDIIHKAYIKIDEEGTEAAAVTGVPLSMSAGQDVTDISMTINRPFFFFIKEDQTDQILFMGVIRSL